MNYKKIILLLVVISVFVLSSLLVGCAKAKTVPEKAATTPAAEKPATAPEKQIVLKFATHRPPSHVEYGKFMQPWAAEVEKRTEGRVKIQFYPGGALAKEDEQFDSLIKGVCDISTGFIAVNPGRFSLVEVAAIPGLGNYNNKQISKALWQLYQEFPEVRAPFSDVHVLWIDTIGTPDLVTKKAISTLEDIKGMKLRAGEGPQSEATKLLGAVPVQMNFNDVYHALERGIIEGVISRQGALTPRKIYEVTKYNLTVGFGTAPSWWAMNLKTWNSLSPDIQKIFNELSGNYGIEARAKVTMALEEEAYELAKKHGTQFSVLPPQEQARWEKAMEPVAEKWAADKDAKGLPGTKVLNRFKELLKAQK